MSTTVEIINSEYKAAVKAIKHPVWTAAWEAEVSAASSVSRQAFEVVKTERIAGEKAAEKVADSGVEASAALTVKTAPATVQTAPAKTVVVVKAKGKNHNRKCVACGAAFVIEAKRGRPPVKCVKCRVVK